MGSIGFVVWIIELEIVFLAGFWLFILFNIIIYIIIKNNIEQVILDIQIFKNKKLRQYTEVFYYLFLNAFNL